MELFGAIEQFYVIKQFFNFTGTNRIIKYFIDICKSICDEFTLE